MNEFIPENKFGTSPSVLATNQIMIRSEFREVDQLSENQNETNSLMSVQRMILRWFDSKISPWTKIGDLDMYYEILYKQFPFERLLLEAQHKDKELSRFVRFCLANFEFLSTKQKTMAILVNDFTL